MVAAGAGGSGHPLFFCIVRCNTVGKLTIMSPVDTSIIEKVYSPVAGWVSHRFGLDQWRLSIECLNGTIAFYLAGVALTIAGKGVSDAIFADLLAAFIWLAFMGGVRRAAYRQANSSLGRQTARMGESVFRHILLGLLPLSLWYVERLDNLCHTASLVLFLSHLYFKACDMPPPRRKQARSLAFSRAS